MPTIVLEAIPKQILPLLALIAVLLLVSAVVFWGVVRLRRYIKSSAVPPKGQSWTLGQIRKLHKSGKLTDKESQALRDSIIKGTKRSDADERLGRQ